MKRRSFLGQSAAAIAGSTILQPVHAAEAVAAAKPPIRIGACVVGLQQARAAGLDGVEVGVGQAAERLEIADKTVRQRYKEQMRESGLPICSLMMELLNSCPLASDPRAPAWLEQSIDAAHDLGARVILLAFFGQGDLLDAAEKVKQGDLDKVVKRIKAAAPRAKDAGVILGIENYLNGEQNARILERIDHESVQLYYDVFNTGTTKHHDVPADLRRLKGRIAQFHFKNGARYLDDEKAKFEPIAAAIKETGYRGWIVLETSSPSNDAVSDARRNGDYARKLLA
jgi:sugar phosphate isomerase/epimerase